MRVIYNDITDPYFNLASEEYLLEESKGDIFMIWRNEKSVIIGKNQNAYGEININFCEKNGIKTVRRLTGGGAVFHDPGNVNFSFITDADAVEGIDFSPFISKVTDALTVFGINAYANGRNDIEVRGTKISGNAQCVYNCKDGRKRLLHHGTLLFDADMSFLEDALLPRVEKLESKGIKSVRSRVINIKCIEGYSGPDNSEDFAGAICHLFSDEWTVLRAEEKNGIEKLARDKYSKWEWNFGESPMFSTVLSRRYPFGTVEVAFTANKGIIEKIKIYGDFFSFGDVSELEKLLLGAPLEKHELEMRLSDTGKYICGADVHTITDLMI